MYRQSPSRNLRSKGIKVKHVLQICLLLAVCFWLIYQVKHSHDKRKEFDESDGRGLLQRESSDDLIKLGRKDIQARSDGGLSKNEKHEEPEEEEEGDGEEVKENKSEEDEPDDKKVEEGKEDEARGGGDDEIDEHEQEKSDEDVDREEDLVDEEKEREDVVENDTQETDSEDGHGGVEKDVSSEDSGDHDGDDGSVNEAREEHYKADDASSAVTHDAQVATTENENENLENSNEKPRNILEEDKNDNRSEGTSDGENRKDLEVEGGETAQDDHQSNTTTGKTTEGMFDNSANGASPNNTVAEGFNARLMNNSTPEVTTENHDLPRENVTEGKPELDHNLETLANETSAEGSDFKTTESNEANYSTGNADSSHLGSNSMDSTELKHAELHSMESSNSSINNSESSESEKIIKPEASEEAGTDGSSPENDSETNANSEVNDSTDEDHADDQHDAIDISDTSNSLEENAIHTDLDTLPESQTEGTNSKDVAAE